MIVAAVEPRLPVRASSRRARGRAPRPRGGPLRASADPGSAYTASPAAPGVHCFLLAVSAALVTAARSGRAAVSRGGLAYWWRSVALTVDDDLARLANRVSRVGDCSGRAEQPERGAGRQQGRDFRS